MARTTHTIDAADKIAGRLASQIAVLLQGKHKPSYQPNIDGGDAVHIANVGKMRFSGKKLEKKVYHRFTGYPGGIRTTRLLEFFQTRPEHVLRMMVKNMLPKNKLQNAMLRRLSFVKDKK
ncbi:MAG: 50S ribosomal protein L13 [Patescibacteria group bacterium]